jgi:hypothetical protein
MYHIGWCTVTYWLRYYATNRQVTGSIPDGVIGIFQWHNPSSYTMVLGSTQPLTEMSSRCISWGKGGRCVRLTTLPPSCTVVMKSGNFNFLEPSGPLHACNGTALPLPLPLHVLYCCTTIIIYIKNVVRFPVPLRPWRWRQQAPHQHGVISENLNLHQNHSEYLILYGHCVILKFSYV